MASMLENVEMQDGCSIGFPFTNFVYTVVEHKIKGLITNSAALVQEEPEVEVISKDLRIVKSYSDEKDAKDFCTRRNESHTGYNPPWLKKEFGSTLSYSIIDPSTHEVRIFVKVYECVKNELHGALLEK
jgi:hypothetical protein